LGARTREIKDNIVDRVRHFRGRGDEGDIRRPNIICGVYLLVTDRPYFTFALFCMVTIDIDMNNGLWA